MSAELTLVPPPAETLPAIPGEVAPEHADGVYFGLDEVPYHADPALGSGDMKRLAYSPEDYWFGSGHNPLREPEEMTDAMLRGRAVHTLVLEGRAKFDRLYRPAWHNGNLKAGKDERKAIKETGATPLRGAEWSRALQAGTIIKNNRFLGEAFSGGHPEVSVFWTTAQGVRKKGRIDYLKPYANVDLKSLVNTRTLSFKAACRQTIAERNHPVQASHYNDGRVMLREHVRAGRVFGPYDPEWLDGVVEEEAWAFVWVFFQASGAPLTWGTMLNFGNGLLDIGAQYCGKAEATFCAYRDRHGVDTPWVIEEPIEELDISELPGWYGMR